MLSPTSSRKRKVLQRIRTTFGATEGLGWADVTPPSEADNRSLVLFDSGDEVTVQAGDEGIRFLLVSGRPLRNRLPGTARS